ncbi:MAG: tyrosine-type recombinase/integrase [bacterium]|nr:tyrosine-type recombinase/integrase [bacterium]
MTIKSFPLQHAVRQFLEYCEVERGRAPATLTMYGFVLDRFLAFAAKRGAKSTEDITMELVRAFRMWLHRRPGRAAETLTIGTQNLHLVILRSFLKFCVKRDIASLAPEKIELPKQNEREVAFLEPEEVERLLAAPLADVTEGTRGTGRILRLRDAAILEVLFSTGMRVGELVRVERDAINLKRGEFAVHGKGGKVRIVFLSDTATGALKRYLDARRDPSPFVFVRHDRAVRRTPEEVRSLSARSVERLVAKYARAAGIVKHVHPHTLRHSFATDLLRGGAQLRDVQAMLGHSSITTTQIYTHVTNRQLRAVHQRRHRRRATPRD